MKCLVAQQMDALLATVRTSLETTANTTHQVEMINEIIHGVAAISEQTTASTQEVQQAIRQQFEAVRNLLVQIEMTDQTARQVAERLNQFRTSDEESASEMPKAA